MTVLAWSPLRNGQLTGKYLPENANSAESKEGRMNSEMMKASDVGRIDARGHSRGGRDRKRDGCFRGAGRACVAAASGGAGHPDRRRTQAQTIVRQPRQPQRHLRDEQLQRLDKVSAVRARLPDDFLALDSVRAISTGGMSERIKA